MTRTLLGRLRWLATVGCIVAGCCAPVAAVDYYVRRSGSDAADGRTPATAFASIAKGAAAVLNPGDRVIVGPGTYAEGDLAPANNGIVHRPVVFLADAAGALTGDAPGAVIVRPPVGKTTAFLFLAKRGVTIDGFTFDAATDACIQVRSSADGSEASADIVVRNVTVAGCSKRGIDITAVGTVVVEDSVATNNVAGISVLGPGGVGPRQNAALGRPVLTLRRNHVYANQGPGIVVERAGGGVIDDNDVHENLLNGIYVRDSEGVTILGNESRSNGDGGIRVDVSTSAGAGTRNVELRGNLVRDNAKGGLSVVATGDIVVAENTSHTNGASGYSVIGTDAQARVDIRQNQSYANVAQGLFVEAVSGGTVRDNTLRDNTGTGLLVRSSTGLALADNVVRNNRDGGVLLGKGVGDVAVGDVSVVRHRIEANVGGALDVVARGRVDIADSSIPNAPGSAIAVAGAGTAQVSIRRCSIERPAQDAVFIDAAAGVDLEGNTLTDAGETAVQVRRSGAVRAVDNDIQRPGRNGIDAQGDAAVEVQQNEIVAAGGVGIVIESPARTMMATLRENMVSDSVSHGLRLAGAAAGSVALNQVRRAGGQGILVDASAGVMLTENSVLTTGFSGMQARTSADLVVAGNEVADSPDGGIDLNADGNVEVRDNDVDRSGDAGVSVISPRGDGAFVVDDNRIGTSGADGIFLQGAESVAVRRNEVRDSLAAAILTRSTSHLVVEENVVADNVDGGILLNKGDTVLGLNAVVARNSVATSGSGIQVFAGGHVDIVGNQVATSPVGGIAVVGDETLAARLDDNIVTDSGADGLLVSGGGAVVASGNEVRRSGQVGIHLPDVTATTLTDNEVRDSVQDAIRVNGSGLLALRGNTLATSGGSSLIATSQDDGAFDLDIEENAVSSHAQGIFVVGCSGGRVVDNHVRSSRLDAILLRNCTDVAVTGNDIEQSGRNGILINGPTAVVGGGFALRDNRVVTSGQNGIQVYARGSVSAVRNVVEGSTLPALSIVAEGRSRLAISDNHLAASQSHGLFVEGADKGVLQNTVTYGHALTGLTLRRSPDMLVANNLVYGNAGDGLAIGTGGGRSPRAVVTNNTIYGNAERGFVLGSGGAASEGATVVNNIIEENGGTGIAVDRLSADSYVSAFNMNSDGYGDDTPRSPFDIEGPAGFLDPLGPDAVLATSDADFRLRQVLGGQASNSRAVDGGSALVQEIGLAGSTAAGGAPDTDRIDMGFHYGAQPSQSVRVPAPYMPLFVRPDGDDANNGRSLTTAWRSLRTAGIRAVAGSTVIVAPGRYVETDTVRVRDGAGRVTFLADRDGSRTGLAPGPVVLDASGADTGFIVLASDDVVIDGFHVTNTATAAIQIREGSDRAVVRNNVVFSNARRGIEIRGGDAGLVANNLVYGNATGGIQLQHTRGSEVSGNTIYGNGENGITVGIGFPTQLGSLDRAHGAGETTLAVRLPSADAVVRLDAGDIVQLTNDAERYRVIAPTTSVAGLLTLAIEPSLARVHASGTAVRDETLAAVDTRVQRNIVAGNQFGLQVRLNSLAGYECGGNVVADGLQGLTPRCDADILADPAFVDPDGVDGVLGGAGFADDDFRLRQATSPAVDLILCDADLPGVAGTTDPDGFPDECPIDAGYHYPLAAVGAL